MKLQTKIVFGFFILAAMLACAGILSIYELRFIGTSVNSLLNDNYKSINAAKAMMDALEMENSGVLLALSGNWQKGKETIESGDRAFQQAFAIAQNNITVADESKYINRIAQQYRACKTSWTKFLGQNPQELNLGWYFEKIHGEFQAAQKSAEELLALNDESMYGTASRLYTRANRAIMPGIVAIASSLAFVLIFNFFINYYVIRPIKDLIREVKTSIHSGSPLNIEIETKDELRDLAAAIKDLSIARHRKA